VRIHIYAHIRTIVVLLGGKLTLFKLCSYGKGNGVNFGIVSNYFVVYEAYFVVGKFQ
jgi:hypothetical protein